MTETYDWSSFYDALRKLGPRLLLGIDSPTREMIEEFGTSTDMFWSDGLQDLLATGASDGDLRAGVLSVLELWRENVLQTIDSNFGIELSWQAVTIDSTNKLIDDLLKAATPGED